MEMDIFEQIREDHQKVGAMISQFMERGGGEGSMMADQIGTVLVPHAKSEEIGLFAALMEHDEARDHIQQAIQEHRGIVQQLQQVAQAPMGDRTEVVSRLEKLWSMIQYHVGREEGKTFDLAADLLAAEQISELSQRFPMDKEDFGRQYRMAA